MCAESIVGLYERHAVDFDRDRSRSLQEKMWLDRFVSYLPPAGVVLDIGCGMAEPIARYLLEAGFQVVGVDSSPTLIQLAKTRFPDSEWIVADMRQLELGRTFDGILAWDSFFHLTPDDQRDMFPRFASHAAPGAPLMFTSGPAHGETTGSYCGEPLYHGSLSPSEYESLMTTNGFRVLAYLANDPDCGEHTVWLARCSIVQEERL
jgi:cyclopropane fatty-acyl-phospholipid synthase-like methyltransferase